MGRGSIATRTHIDLARVGFGVGDELKRRVSRDRWIHQQDIRRAHDARNWRDVLQEIEGELLEKCGINRVTGTPQEERVAVCRRAHDRLGAYVAASTWAVLDDKLLAELLRQPLADQTRDDVVP